MDNCCTSAPPVCQWHGPFLADIAISQIDKLVKCVVRRKDALGLGDFADLTVVALYGIGGVDDLTDGRGILIIAAQQLPFVSPRLDDNGIKFAPLLLHMIEFRFRFFLCVSGIDKLDVFEKFLPIITAYILYSSYYPLLLTNSPQSAKTIFLTLTNFTPH